MIRQRSAVKPSECENIAKKLKKKGKMLNQVLSEK